MRLDLVPVRDFLQPYLTYALLPHTQFS